MHITWGIYEKGFIIVSKKVINTLQFKYFVSIKTTVQNHI